MNILLLGANGRTGRELLARALSAGHTVTGLVRAEDRLADVSHRRLHVRVGSPCDPSVLVPLLPGQDVVVSLLGPRLPSKMASAIYPESAAAMVDALQASGVERLLVTSSALLFPPDKLSARVLRRLVPHIVDGARRMEERIRRSSLDWTIARTGFLNNNRATNHRLGVDALPKGAGSVSRAAVSSFLLQAAEQGSHSQQIVGLCG